MRKRRGRVADVQGVAAAADLGAPRGGRAVSNQYNLFFEGGLQVAIGTGFAVGAGVAGLLGDLALVAAAALVVVGGLYALMHCGVLATAWHARRGRVHLFERGLVVGRRGRADAFRWDDAQVDVAYDEGTRSRIWWITRSDGRKLVLYASVSGVSPLTRRRLQRASGGSFDPAPTIALAQHIDGRSGGWTRLSPP